MAANRRKFKGSAKTVKKKRQFLLALKKAAGNVTAASEKIGINRTTYYRWLQTDPEFAKEVEMVNETLLDFAETKLMQLIKDGNVTAIIFYLKTKGKKRGYVEKNIVENEGGLHIVIEEREAKDNEDG